ncbi:hypothetical protein [Flavobacterium maritimum]|uniref:hypothetical protein n=1 Tax=Flavobacterium maritimum TaxID=3149042 RepID=UPI0032B5C90B
MKKKLFCYQLNQVFSGKDPYLKNINNAFKEDDLDKNTIVEKIHIANSDKKVLFFAC